MNLFLVGMFQPKRFVIIVCTFSDVSVISTGYTTFNVHLVAFFLQGRTKGYGQHTILSKISKKQMHEIEKILGRMMSAGDDPLDPPMLRAESSQL